MLKTVNSATVLVILFIEKLEMQLHCLVRSGLDVSARTYITLHIFSIQLKDLNKISQFY